MGRKRTGGSGGHSSTVEILHAVGRSFGSASDPHDGIRRAIPIIREAIGPDAAVAIFLPDRTGRLRRVAGTALAAGSGSPGADRRRAFQTGLPCRIAADSPATGEIAYIPLLSAGRMVGLLEVASPSDTLESLWDVLLGAAGPLAVAVSEIRERARHQAEVQAVADEEALVRALLQARSPEGIARAVVRFCGRRLRVPVAAWLTVKDGTVHELVGLRGMTRESSAALREAVPSIPRWETLESVERWEAMSQFAVIVKPQSTGVLHARDLLVFVGASPPAVRGALERVGHLVDQAMGRLATIKLADRRARRIDLGLAWTAHELRSPLLGAKAAIERLIVGPSHTNGSAKTNGGAHAGMAMNGNGNGSMNGNGSTNGHGTGNGHGSISGHGSMNGHGTANGQAHGRSLGPLEEELLLRSWQELDQLSGQVESLLRWGVGEPSLRRRRTDVGHVVHEAVRDASRAVDAGRVSVATSGDVRIVADGDSLRVAISNLVRNALAYSPQDSPVAVRVYRRDGVVRISVKDRGAGVAHGEQDAIFDPFVRGRTGRHARAGNGLGLFIARRVVEAHGGAIRVESSGVGATFHIELPAKAGKWNRRVLAF